MKLNDTWTIGRKMAAIDDYKELTMAIASSKMVRVGNLLESGRANHAGVHRLVGLCLRASVGKVRAAQYAANLAMGLLLLCLHTCSRNWSPRIGSPKCFHSSAPYNHPPSSTIVWDAYGGLEIESNIDSCLESHPQVFGDRISGHASADYAPGSGRDCHGEEGSVR